MKLVKLKFLNSHVEAKVFVGLLILVVISLLVPHLLRHFSNPGILVGDESYYFMKAAGDLKEYKPFYGFFKERAVFFVGLVFSLAFFSFILNMPVKFVCNFLPFLIGVLSFILFYLLLKKFKVDFKVRLASSLILMISPPFLYLFSTCNRYFFPVFFGLVGIYFFEKRWLFLLSLVLMALFNFQVALISLALFFCYVLIRQRNLLKLFFLTVAIVLFVAFLAYIPILREFGAAQKILFETRGISFVFQHFIADLGGKFGLSIFGILLGAVGLISGWKDKKSLSLAYCLFLVLFLLSLKWYWVVVYLNFVLVFFAGYGLIELIVVRWESELIRDLTILILICGLIFSGLSYEHRYSNFWPNDDVMRGLRFLDKPGEGPVFSHYSRGFWIESVGRGVLMDGMFVYSKDANEKWEDSLKLFKVETLSEGAEILNKYGIKHIWIDKEMKEGLVWNKEDEGLLFLLKFSKSFKKVYSNNNVEIWEFVG